ncbi:MAG: hypothetical protein ACI4UU_00500 [Clostridia bacterium]
MNYSGYFKDSEGNLYYPRSMQKITTGVEFETGRIIDGKKEYGKRFKQLLSNSPGTTTIETGLTNVEFTYFEVFVNVGGWAYKTVSNKVNDYTVNVSIETYDIKVTTYTQNYKTYYAIAEVHYLKN